MKIGNFWHFCHFRCHFATFSSRKMQYTLQKRLLDNQLFPVDLLKQSNQRNLSKIWQEMCKNFEKWNSLGFLSFSVSIWDFVNWKTEIISTEKPTGQQTSTMLSVFNILIHEFYRNFDKNCIKTLKIGNFFVFFVFFSFKKTHLSLHKWLLDNEFLSCWNVSTF